MIRKSTLTVSIAAAIAIANFAAAGAAFAENLGSACLENGLHDVVPMLRNETLPTFVGVEMGIIDQTRTNLS